LKRDAFRPVGSFGIERFAPDSEGSVVAEDRAQEPMADDEIDRDRIRHGSFGCPDGDLEDAWYRWPQPAGAHPQAARCDLYGVAGQHTNAPGNLDRSEEHTSELQSLAYPVCRLLL